MVVVPEGAPALSLKIISEVVPATISYLIVNISADNAVPFLTSTEDKALAIAS